MKSSTLWRHLSSNMRRVSLLIIPGLYGDITNIFFSEQTSCKICSISVKVFTYKMLCLVVCLLLRIIMCKWFTQWGPAKENCLSTKTVVPIRPHRFVDITYDCRAEIQWSIPDFMFYSSSSESFRLECQLLSRRVLHPVSLHSRFSVHFTCVNRLDALYDVTMRHALLFSENAAISFV